MSAIPALIASNGAAAAAADARKKALQPFIEAGAFGPGETIDWRPDGKGAEALVKAGVLREVRPGRWYHDRSVTEYGSGQAARKILVLVAGLLLLGGFVLIVSL